MTPAQKDLVTKAIGSLKTISINPSQPLGEVNLGEMMRAGGVANGFIDFGSGSATGFSTAGMVWLAELAKGYRPDGSRRGQQASNATLTKYLAGVIARAWGSRIGETPSDVDFAAIGSSVESWFTALDEAYLHAVPCILLPYPAPSFTIGPVHFHHWQDFPTEQFGITQDQFWSTAKEVAANPEIGGWHFSELVKMAKARHAAWVAVVKVSGRAERESVAAADIAVDIALGALQIAAPGLDVRNVARATGRIPALWRADVWARGSRIQQSNSNHSPALAISPALFAKVIAEEVGKSLAVMGQRLSDYLGFTSSVPLLNEAWCNAAYWFHEACAEPLDTVVVVKLETSIEVLFRAEDMSGSKSRLKKSFDAIFGLAEADLFPGRAVTIGQFILNVTTARSRVVHGTWPTIHTDLPGYRNQRPVGRAEVELVAGSLLIEMAHYIDAYVAAGETGDDTDTLLDWIKARARQPAAPIEESTSHGLTDGLEASNSSATPTA